MRLVSFDLLRTLGFPNTTYLKPEYFFRHKAELQMADWVLFPEYWQLNPLIYGLQCRVFPSQASFLIGHNKIEMTRAFECIAPANTPFTLIKPNLPQYQNEIWDAMATPFVAKLPKSSMGEGVWLIETIFDWRRYIARTDTLYAQEYLPIDRDIRVVIVGDEIIASYWRRQSDRGFYNNIARGGSLDFSPVPDVAIELALKLARGLDINHAGFDIAMVDGHPYVFEFNRMFGTRGIEGAEPRLRQAIINYLERDRAPTRPRPQTPRIRRGTVRRVA